MKKSTTVATMANGLLKVLQRYTKGDRKSTRLNSSHA